MMETKAYIVILERGVDYTEFWQEMETAGTTLSYVPNRAVAIVDDREAMDRMCVYALSDNEAEVLQQDPRVKAVEIPFEKLNDWVIVSTATQDANFNKPSTAAGTNKNWGLVRHNYATNVYGTSTSTALDYIYTLDGSNVDVIILDTGIQANHPEWQDASGVSRFKNINWFTYTNTVGTQPTGFYTDVDGHGTACAGVAVGKTFGWAKNANIYSITTYNNPGNEIDYSIAVQLIKKFHQQKPINPATGVKNPTIVNMSFTQYWSGTTLDYTHNFITYRNVRYNTVSPSAIPGGDFPNYNYGLVFYPGQPLFGGGRLPRRNNQLDVPVQDLLDTGIVVVIAAANDKQKIDVPGGVDWLNSINILTRPPSNTIPSTYYYMQGSSPYDSDAVIVGAIDSTPANASTDQKAIFSRAGPGVDIFAAGANVMTSLSNTSINKTIAPYNNTDPVFKQTLINGTSFAAPQIVGMSALYLQANPTATPAQVKSWLITNSVPSALFNTGLTNDYSNQRSQWGGTAGVAFQALQGIVKIKDNSGVWKNVKDIQYKNPTTGQWAPIKAGFTKTETGWKQIY